jgi:hypothetical protein
MQPWFAWQYTEVMLTAFTVCFLLLRFVLFSKNYTINYSVLAIVLFAFLVNFMVRLRLSSEILTVFNFIRVIILFTFVIAMTDNEKKQIATLTTTLYAWIVGISLIAFLFVFIMGIQLPHSIIKKPDNLWYSPFDNYRLFIVLQRDTSIFQRFQSIFTEPGHLGMISSFLLYINRYELKRKSVLIIFVSLIMSFSLAAYILLVMGYLIYITANSKNIYKSILIISIIVVSLATVSYFYYNKYPDSIVSKLILRRLTFSETRGIRGNNRTTSKFNYHYEKKYLTSTENILWGQRLSEFQFKSLLGYGGNNSYKVFLLRFGSISLILLFLMYFSIVVIKPSLLGFGLLILYCASFWQRTYALWDMQLFLFIGSVQYFYDGSISYQRKISND